MDYSNMKKIIDTSSWSDVQERILIEPYTYLSQNPGKEIRTKLIDAFNIWLDVPEEDLGIVRKVIRMLHGGSLLMDDVEDDSLLRRGIPVAHKIYGVPQTINAANYVYFLAYQELFKFRRRDEDIANRSSSGGGGGVSRGVEDVDGKGKRRGVVKGLDEIITEELLNLHRGQGLDLFWRDSLTCPSEEEYIHMVLGKTGGLFRIAIKLMMDRSSSSVDYVPLVNLISILFQIRDDYMNLQSTEYTGNKGYCEDLTEGKFSFPVVHAVRADAGSRELLNILQKRTTSHSLKSRAVDIMRTRTKSFEYTLGVLKTLEGQVKEEIARLGGNAALEAIVDALSVREEMGEEGERGEEEGEGQ